MNIPYLHILAALVFIALSGLVGFFSYSAIGYAEERDRAREIIQRFGGTTALYGTVTAYDPTTRTVSFERLNPYHAQGEKVVSQRAIRADAYVGRQTIADSNGITTVQTDDVADSELVETLVPGTNIRATLIVDDGIPTIVHLLVGNPL